MGLVSAQVRCNDPAHRLRPMDARGARFRLRGALRRAVGAAVLVLPRVAAVVHLVRVRGRGRVRGRVRVRVKVRCPSMRL